MRHVNPRAPDFASISAEGAVTATEIPLVESYVLVSVFDNDAPDRNSQSDQANSRLIVGSDGIFKVDLSLMGAAGGANKEYTTHVYEVDPSGVTITDATQADPVVVTAAGHGFSNGDEVLIQDVSGMTELNDRIFKVADKTTDTFELTDDGGASPANDIDGLLFTAYSSGGTVYAATKTRVSIRQMYAVGGDVEPGADHGLLELTAGQYLMACIKGVTDTTNITFEHLTLSHARVD